MDEKSLIEAVEASIQDDGAVSICQAFGRALAKGGVSQFMQLSEALRSQMLEMRNQRSLVPEMDWTELDLLIAASKVHDQYTHR